MIKSGPSKLALQNSANDHEYQKDDKNLRRGRDGSSSPQPMEVAIVDNHAIHVLESFKITF